MTATTHAVTVRWLIRRDMDEVMAIERSSFGVPWTEGEFLEFLRQQTNIGMVAASPAGIRGYVLYELHTRRLHIANLAVAADSRRCGIATQMVQRLQDKLSGNRRSKLTLDVSESNTAGQLFFQRRGFWCSCIRPGFFDGHDAYHMYYQLPSELSPQRKLEWD